MMDPNIVAGAEGRHKPDGVKPAGTEDENVPIEPPEGVVHVGATPPDVAGTHDSLDRPEGFVESDEAAEMEREEDD